MKIYLDNAATTKVKPEVAEEMIPFIKYLYGNPSSVYEIARVSKKATDDARKVMADSLNAAPSEIFFTSGGTESDNWAIKGAAFANRSKGNHIITTKIEHHAVLHTCEFLEKNGFQVDYLPVNGDGIVEISDLLKALRPDTILISVMFANNEIGTLQPIAEIGKIARDRKIIFHTDAVQAYGHEPIDVKALGIDLLSLSGHKIHGPKGVGALYIRNGVQLETYAHGGAQERGRRAGTENVAGIVGLAKAAELCAQNLEEKTRKITDLRNKLIDGLLKIPYTRLNGSRDKRLANNANISFRFIEGESLLLLLDMNGIFASSGSACTSGSLDPSHVLLSIGLPHEIAHGSLRLTLSDETTEEEINTVLETLPKLVQRLRDMSPLYEDFIKAKTS
jgi:cysteine desulfurase